MKTLKCLPPASLRVRENVQVAAKNILVVETRRLIAIAGAQRNMAVPPPPDAVWIDCGGCGKSIMAYFDSVDQARTFTDDEAITLFARYGWGIFPDRCPGCREVES